MDQPNQTAHSKSFFQRSHKVTPMARSFWPFCCCFNFPLFSNYSNCKVNMAYLSCNTVFSITCVYLLKSLLLSGILWILYHQWKKKWLVFSFCMNSHLHVHWEGLATQASGYTHWDMNLNKTCVQEINTQSLIKANTEMANSFFFFVFK